MKIKAVDQYLAAQPKEARTSLRNLREIILKAAPDAEEYMSYGMPGYRQNGMLCWFAGCKEHYSLYVRPNIKKPFEEKLKKYKTTKSSIHFNYKTPLQEKLIKDIIKHALKINGNT